MTFTFTIVRHMVRSDVAPHPCADRKLVMRVFLPADTLTTSSQTAAATLDLQPDQVEHITEMKGDKGSWPVRAMLQFELDLSFIRRQPIEFVKRSNGKSDGRWRLRERDPVPPVFLTTCLQQAPPYQRRRW